jgi:hypothetical protein
VVKICPYCAEEEIEDEDYACFHCAYELMDDIERESL